MQNKIEIIKKRYESEGYSLARIDGPDRILEDGIVTLNVSVGIISDVKLRFLGLMVGSIIDGKPRRKNKRLGYKTRVKNSAWHHIQ